MSDKTARTGAMQQSSSQLGPPASRREYMGVKPKECPKCFSERIHVRRSYQKFVCDCDGCNHYWEEIIREPDEGFRDGVRISKDFDLDE